jgi:DNA-binding transcriptional LysR family regulator
LLRVRAESLLAEAEFLTLTLRDERQAAGGIVRMTAPTELGTHFIEQVAPLLASTHPGVKLALKLSYDFDDLLDPSIDIALRAGTVHDDRLVATPVGEFRRVAVASPAYLDASPVTGVAQLAQHACLIFSDTDTQAEWSFARKNEVENVRVAGVLSVRSFTALLHASRAGLGIARIPEFAAHEYLLRGELLQVLSDWTSPPTTVFAAYRFGHDRIARVAAVLQAVKSSNWLVCPQTNKQKL